LVFGLVSISIYGNNMAKNAKVTITTTLAGAEISSVMSRSDEEATSISLEPAAGKDGTLTTRTSDTAGVLTVATGHGITTSDKVCVFFTAGVATNFTVSATTATTITIASGGGTALPIATSAIIVSVIATHSITIVGDSLSVFQIGCNRRCWVDLLNSSPASIVSFLITEGEGRFFVASAGMVNALAGATVATIKVANGSTKACAIPISLLRTTD